jgi:hypothetical protein
MTGVMSKEKIKKGVKGRNQEEHIQLGRWVE